MLTRFLGQGMEDEQIRMAAWVARCVGRKETSPLSDDDLAALAEHLSTRQIERGGVLFSAGQPPQAVWIVREGMLELVVGAGRKRQVVQLLHAGDVDGDIQLILGMPPPYTARAATDVQALSLGSGSFQRIILEHPTIAQRWLSSVAERLVRSQTRILGLLGRGLPSQVARLLIEEAVDGRIELPQRTLSAMLGVHRPSFNKVLKDMEHRGLVRIGYSEIEVIDHDRLTELAR